MSADPCNRGKRGRDSVTYESYSARRPTASKKQIIEVPSVAAEWRAPISQTAGHGENGVQERKPRGQEWKKAQRSRRGFRARKEVEPQKRDAEAP